LTTKRNSPGVGTEAVKDSAGGLNTSSVTENPTTSPGSAVKIGATVEKALDATLWRFRSGEITLDDLTPALQAFFLDGHAAALASVLPELTRAEQTAERANADADRLYRLAYTPAPPIKVGPSYASVENTRAEIYGGTR
jgi:hypothetical protein